MYSTFLETLRNEDNMCKHDYLWNVVRWKKPRICESYVRVLFLVAYIVKHRMSFHITEIIFYFLEYPHGSIKIPMHDNVCCVIVYWLKVDNLCRNQLDSVASWNYNKIYKLLSYFPGNIQLFNTYCFPS